MTTLWFVAFGALGEAIARNSRKGDQLVVEARVRASNWTDKQGGKQYDHSFVVQGFRFGAPGRTKREERDARREDGHGLQRSEERPNGRDRSANNGAHLSLGGNGSAVPPAGNARGADLRPATDSAAAAADGTVGEANEPVSGNEDAGANANAESDPTAGADLGTAATVGQTVRGNDDVDANEVAGTGDGANPVASGATKDGARRSAGAGANRGSEKTSGGRSSRRAAGSAA